MSINSAMNNATSGLAAASRMVDVISSNTANALTDGYGRREVQLSSARIGGVKIDGVTRQVSAPLLQEKWLSAAAATQAESTSTALNSIEKMFGYAGEAGSLHTTLSDLQSSLITATANPDKTASLSNVVTAAKRVTEKTQEIATGLKTLANDADASVTQQINHLNTTLSQIADLNKAITRGAATGNDVSALMDQRQVMVDSISESVSVRIVARPGQQIAIFAESGLSLLDGTPQPISSAMQPMLTGGDIAAQTALRDTIIPMYQADLDAFSRDLIERFSTPELSSPPPGLFTDAGQAFSASQEKGLALRIGVNTSVDPDTTTGSVERLRDRLGTDLDPNSPRSPNDASILAKLTDAFTTPVTPASGSVTSTAGDALDFASNLLSKVSTARLSADSQSAYLSAKSNTAKQQVLSQGVDTDREMQMLLQVEQAYAANARVIQAVDDMMRVLQEL